MWEDCHESTGADGCCESHYNCQLKWSEKQINEMNIS